MAVRPIVKYGHPVLHKPSEPVRQIDAGIRQLLDDMVETMFAAPGIGLAAPQIAVPLRVIVGCLSAPGFGGSPVRPARVVVKGLDRDGVERTYEGTDLLARAFCHEIDHIDGLLFVDRLTPLKRDLLKRKLRKKARSDDWDE